MKSVNLENMKSRQNTILNEIKQKEERLMNTPEVNNQLSLNLNFNETQKKTQNTSNAAIANSSRKASARQASARKNSARKIPEFESHLTQQPSNSLKSIANRELPANSLINQSSQGDLGDFFLLAVETAKKPVDTIIERPTSSLINNQKVSYKCKLCFIFFKKLLPTIKKK